MFKEPGFHVYEVAPLAVNVADCPTQIVLDTGETVIVGLFTTSCTVLLEGQPSKFVPVTV